MSRERPDGGAPAQGAAVVKISTATRQHDHEQATSGVDQLLAAVDPGRRDLLAAVLALDGVSLAVLLSVLPADHELVAAARVGVDAGELRRDHQAAMVEASHAVAGALDWHRYADQRMTHEELQRLRFPPHGDHHEWVRTGGAA